MRKFLPLTLVALLATMPALAADNSKSKNKSKGSSPALKLQCWTDDKGVRACGDRVPPQYAKDERQVLNAQGIVVSTKSRQKTEAEVAEAERLEQAAVVEKKRFEEQSAYDKYMLQTFDSVTQMEGVRDTRIATLEGRLRLAEKSVIDTEGSLKGLRERATAAEAAGKKVESKLTKQIAQFETSLVDTLQSVAQMKKEREEITAKSHNDVERFKKLRAGQIQVGSKAELSAPAP